MPAQDTSRTCPSCGHICRDNLKSQAAFACVTCDFADNADLVAAINVLTKGGDTPASPVK